MYYTPFKLHFALATELQIDEIYNMFLAAVEDMNKKGIKQWDSIYPNRDIIENDVKSCQMYVAMVGKAVAAAYVINDYYDDEYNNGNWKYPNVKYKIVHRLCVNPAYQNMGVGRAVMLYIEKVLKRQGVQAIRLDAFTENPYALRLYKGLGYSTVGYADWRMGRFFLMEKKI